MLLELDLGNTKAKWRLLDGCGEVVCRGYSEVQRWASTGFPEEWSGGLRRVRCASVLSADVERWLEGVISDRYGVDIEFAKSCSAVAGLRNAYAVPDALGVDRWLALLAAYQENRSPALVVQFGSALTVDLVDGDGKHRGGYIAPGPRLMQESLLRDTARVRFLELSSLRRLDFGIDTRECVEGGVAAAQVGVVLVALQKAKALLGCDVALYISGGWAEDMALSLGSLGVVGCVVAPELVLDGLSWALP